MPANIHFFKYDWRKEIWNLFFVAGIFIGGMIAAFLLTNPLQITVHPSLVQVLSNYGIVDYHYLMPKEIFSWGELLTLRGFLIMVVGGFMIGFGTRYAGGCTSGHAIMGLSTLQWPSLVATLCFMVGGFIMANVILPFILSL